MPDALNDIVRVQQTSNKLHVKWLLGVPLDWKNHAGEALVLDVDENNLMFATVGTVVQDKVRIDSGEPSKYLESLIDTNTLEITGPVGTKVIAVKDIYLKTTGGTLTGNISVNAGVKIDGVDISDLAARAFDKYDPGTQTISGNVIIAKDLVVHGTITGIVSPGAWFQEEIESSAPGNTKVFTISKTPVAVQALSLFCNGVFQTQNVHYTIVGKIITFPDNIPAGWNISAMYMTNEV